MTEGVITNQSSFKAQRSKTAAHLSSIIICAWIGNDQKIIVFQLYTRGKRNKIKIKLKRNSLKMWEPDSWQKLMLN